MDQFDQDEEFQMKPITPGLGFHKRQVSLKEHIAKSGAGQQKLRKSLPTEPPTELLDNQTTRSPKEIIAELHAVLKPSESRSAHGVRITETFPREISDVRRPVKPEISPIENINFQIPEQNITDSVRRGAHDNLTKPLTAIPVSFGSMILDGAIVLAVSLIFMVTLILVTGVDLSSVLLSSKTEFATQLSLMALYLAVFEMYMIISRSFFGSTLGEWTFDLQMGNEVQIAQTTYPLKVLWRSVLNLVTGFVVLPIISLVFGKDIAAPLTGIQLYRRNI